MVYSHVTHIGFNYFFTATSFLALTKIDMMRFINDNTELDMISVRTSENEHILDRKSNNRKPMSRNKISKFINRWKIFTAKL